MHRVGVVLVVSALTVVFLSAQAPQGWRFRADRSVSASDPDAPGAIRFVTRGSGFHATNPQAAVYWNPANVVNGSYAVEGTFTLVTPSNHTNYYGLVFGGRDLEGPGQAYLYFLVAQDGTWLVKRRDGDASTYTVIPKTHSAAIKTPDASGQSTNTLQVRVTPTTTDFAINGTVVNRWLDAGRMVTADGIYGLRVNHFLEVNVDGFAAAPLPLVPVTSIRSEAATMTMTAVVDRRISATAFTLRPTSTTVADGVLVIAPTLQRAVDREAQLTVFGEMVPFDSVEMARTINDDRLELPADLTAAYRGRSVLMATSVLDQKMVDLTQRVPPPMTNDEIALSALMKRIAPTFATLGQAAGGSNARLATDSSTTLSQAFAEVETFWKAQHRVDGTAWALEAVRQSESVRAAVSSGQWGLVKPALATLGQQCQACHAAYREPFADGSFRIKRNGGK